LGSRLSNPENQHAVQCSQGQRMPNIKRGNMKRIFVLKWILALVPFIAVPESNGQIPSTGSDLSSLSNVSWGMKMDEAKARINLTLDTGSDSTLQFDDSFLQSKVKVILIFGKRPDFEGLKTVDMQFDNKNLVDKLFSYLKIRYGEKFETKSQEKTKLFFTVQLETKKWTQDHERIVLIKFSNGNDILALNLLYAGTGKDQK
jgi:hypothetical protein